jgi:hypothetical protein
MFLGSSSSAFPSSFIVCEVESRRYREGSRNLGKKQNLPQNEESTVVRDKTISRPRPDKALEVRLPSLMARRSRSKLHSKQRKDSSTTYCTCEIEADVSLSDIRLLCWYHLAATRIASVMLWASLGRIMLVG